ncbi:cytochrome P450 736A117-like [Malania oleifera]|uniref:cytochrome P450 736A117-like n=1 Tax=Malania oleifera TaxID=397392 RepID=UPI0025ADABEE|nr:cytochrome P450 736A117-like [Malania oleifera]
MASFLQFLGQQGVYFVWNPIFLSLPPLFLALFLLKCFSTPSTTRCKKLPPSPPKLPVFGNLHQLGLQPHRSLRSLAQRHGPFMLLHFGCVPVLVASSADAAREIMKTHDLIFSNRPKLSMNGKLLYNFRDIATAPYGEYWRQMRSICVLQLLSNRRVESLGTVRHDEMVLLVEKIELATESCGWVNLGQMLMGMTNDVVCRVALGRKYGEGDGSMRFKETLDQFQELLGGFYIGDFIPWLGWVNRVNGVDGKAEMVFRELDSFLDEVVEGHSRKREGGKVEGDEEKDFVDVLLEIQKDNSAGFSMDRECIKALILDMFAAGTDTTYTVLEWAMTELLRHPAAMKELQNEVRGISSSTKPHIAEKDLGKMHYLKAVIKETLRLHPPVPLLVPRESTQAVRINGYDIAAGTMTIINAWAIGRDPAFWDEPEEFRPERFLNSSMDFRGQDFQLIPFGAGRRGCPGTSFAMATNEIVLANIVCLFDWALPGGARGEDLDMTENSGITVHRKVPLLAVATPHSR